MPTVPPGLAGEALRQSIALLERAVEHLRRISACLEERRQIEQTEGRIRLHDLPFLLILGEKIAVSEQYVSHQTPLQRTGRPLGDVGRVVLARQRNCSSCSTRSDHRCCKAGDARSVT